MSKRKKKRLRVKWNNVFKLFKAIIIIVLVCFIGFKFFNWYGDFRRVNSLISKIQEDTTISNIVDDTTTSVIEPNEDISKFAPYWNYINLSLIDVDLDELRKVNSNIVGWLEIKGTQINYPVVKGTDNTYYTNHSLDNKKNYFGSVYIDSQTNLNDVPLNTIILGNKTYMNTLFGKLGLINKPSWKQNDSNHVIKFVTDNYTALYQVFSVFKQKGISSIKINPDENYLNEILNKSNFDFKSNVNANDKIITICTNSSKTNLVIYGKLIKIKRNVIPQVPEDNTEVTNDVTEGAIDE